MIELRDRPIFICGHPKSGTSLLRNLLDFHPQLVVYPEESRFFRQFLPLAKDALPEERMELAKQHLIHIFQWNQENPPAHQGEFIDRNYDWISYPDVEANMAARIKQQGIRHLGDTLSAAVLAFSEVVSPPDADPIWWVEKTPYNEYYARQIFEWWPQARCIHVVRDPCDNYASYRRKQSDWAPEFFATNWLESILAGQKNQRVFGKERYWILRYEDLVLQPERILVQLLDFLEIEDHLALRTPTRAGLDWQGNSMFNETFEGISASPVGRWKSELSQHEAAIIQLVARKTAKQLGYPVDARKGMADLYKAAVWQLQMKAYYLKRGTTPEDIHAEGL